MKANKFKGKLKPANPEDDDGEGTAKPSRIQQLVK